jgi:UPF0176 protein
MTVTVTAFYKFVAIADGELLRSRLLAKCGESGIRGTILIAPEGINATVAGSDAGVRGLLEVLRADPRFSDLESKQSFAETPPFQRLKVKLKREIVTFGVPEADPSLNAGSYVDPQDWNALIQDPDVVVIDARNAYEFAIGTFARAVDPKTRAFSEFPAFVAAELDPKTQPKVAMFCTGGIRCEKASAYMLGRGFREVYHLRGGILKYLETVPRAESLFHGECFVFDERVALDHGVVEGMHRLCPACGYPVAITTDDLGCPSCVKHLP